MEKVIIKNSELKKTIKIIESVSGQKLRIRFDNDFSPGDAKSLWVQGRDCFIPTIMLSPKGYDEASIAHEVLHLWLRTCGFPNHFVPSTVPIKQIDNTFQHEIIYQTYSKLGYARTDFISENNKRLTQNDFIKRIINKEYNIEKDADRIHCVCHLIIMETSYQSIDDYEGVGESSLQEWYKFISPKIGIKLRKKVRRILSELKGGPNKYVKCIHNALSLIDVRVFTGTNKPIPKYLNFKSGTFK